MKVDITALLSMFDELVRNPGDEELGVYWFKATREDGLKLKLFFSVVELYVCVFISNNSHMTISSVDMKNCSEIKVLDQEKKHLEIIHSKSPGRCFLQLTGDTIVSYDE